MPSYISYVMLTATCACAEGAEFGASHATSILNPFAGHTMSLGAPRLGV